MEFAGPGTSEYQKSSSMRGLKALKKAAGCRFEQQFTEIKPIFVLEAANN